MRIPKTSSLLAIMLLCMCFCSLVFGVSGLCREDQRSLLLQLKNSLTFNNVNSTEVGPGYPDCCWWSDRGGSSISVSSSTSKLMSWNQSHDCCQWNGVSCDGDGHVTGLDLSGESITRGFDNSSSLFSLHYLENLNLAYNEFNSVIPSGFQTLKNLTSLNLSYAGFVGQIPLQISLLTRLVTLDISSSSLLTGEELKLVNPNLPKLVQNLTSIRQLYLDGVTISAQGKEWCDALLSLPHLQELSMSACNLSGPIDPSLTKLENLSVVRLDQNELSSTVPETFANLKNLTTLSLANCRLTGIFPQKIFQLRTLSYIDISYNIDLHGSLPEFPQNGSLNTLIVSNTSFSGPLPNSIGNLRELSVLDLSQCQFKGTIPFSLSNLTKLVHLVLNSNSFTGSVPSLGECKKLFRIDFSHNYLTGAIPSTHFQGLTKLVDIELQDNSFSGKIPSSIFVLPSVRNILLSHNQFDGQLDDIFDTSSRLSFLDLSSNHLEGPVPLSVFQLRELHDLKLSFNKFNGTIELNMITKLGNLTTLDLSYNNLSIIDATPALSPFPPFPKLSSVSLASCKLTKFPQFLKNQSGLVYLDLSDNHIAGFVPHWISNLNSLLQLNLSYNYLTNWEKPLLNNMSELFVLDLHSNHLQGPLPALPRGLLYLDYSSNNLSSIIPPNIGSYIFSSMFLSFSSNNLHGNIPESICNASFLEVLDLSNNALTGTIPKCLIAMNGALDTLDLGRNKLSGTIETSPGSCGLRSLHLNGNSLRGNLPKYLVHCTKLEVLDLGNNQIHDQFPCWLKSISTLRVLIMRANKLHGSLECGGTQAAWPHLQIIDLASNNFSGRIPMSFFQTWKAMMVDENDASLSKVHHLQFQILSFGQIYYKDKVTVTSKQQQMDLVKILTIFTAIDLSCNKFEGLIPEGLGKLNALYILNLSHNAFSGHIPSSFGNMKDLESLDLSNNNLSGEIPTQIASLSFLSFLNLSYNQLVGRIPKGTQIQSFEAASFNGNDGLFGPPLTQSGGDGDGVQGLSPPASKNSHTDTESSIDWNIISAELGFTFGIGIVVLSLVFCQGWRRWYWERVDDILYRIFPKLDFGI